MVLLKIFDLDGNDSEKPLSTFQIGEHVIGRGSFANVFHIPCPNVYLF